MGGLTGTDHEKTTAHQLATLQMRLGGLGLRRASRVAPAAFCSSWADALQRGCPTSHTPFVESLDGPREVGGCLAHQSSGTQEGLGTRLPGGRSHRTNVKLPDMNIAVRADDEWCIEVVAYPLFHGAQLAVDITVRCALTSRGQPRSGCSPRRWNHLSDARADKAQKHAELLVGLVVGSLWLHSTGRHRSTGVRGVSCAVPGQERPHQHWHDLHSSLGGVWSRMLSISCARAFATSLMAKTRALHAELRPRCASQESLIRFDSV